jgi:hypothetical protein
LTASERKAARILSKAKWQIARGGWPDFLCYNRGQFLAVEVKVVGQKPKPHQKLMHGLLRKAGIPVEVMYVSPNNREKVIFFKITVEQYKILEEMAERESRTVANMITVILDGALEASSPSKN